MSSPGATRRDPVEELLGKERVVLVSPAGCGKTQIIADALARQATARHLVLTHTHAGVASLRRRLVRLRVPLDRFKVETIAAWCLRVSASYPQLSGLGTAMPIGHQWNETYSAAQTFLRSPVGKKVVHKYLIIYVYILKYVIY